ncbi:hypothetical protein SK128_004139 [Halocaridina rubra]|uniref:Beta-hexosaminidase n=1 Tax=Halocaridina rubra TaxID=373956 RepID=A0AAN9AFU4_HALRR
MIQCVACSLKGIMWREILVTALFCLRYGEGGFPYIVPSVGQIWPQPQHITTEQTYMVVRPNSFSFTLNGYDCVTLQDALKRYTDIMFNSSNEYQIKKVDPWTKTQYFSGYLDTVHVNLLKPCEHMPYLGMDEQYSLKIDTPDDPGKGTLISESIWGMLRGLESFSQLLIPDGSAYTINSTQITDYPRFRHRGLLIDSARHYLPKSKLLETVDLLGMNKFNVLHWHIVDDQSFPFVSTQFPNLSGKGAYSQERLYDAQDIADVVEYARNRGVRVVVEFDTPGHTRSWGPGQDGLLTTCYSDGKPDGNYGPIDPTNDDNYDFLTLLFTEITSHFPDHYVHLGGDEVSFDCWESNPTITQYMKDHNITGDYGKLEEVYVSKLLQLISNLPTKNGYIVWQEVFDNGVAIANDTVVHVWKGGWQDEMANVTKAGYETILSSCWYLDHITYGTDWKTYYGCEPFSFNGTQTQNNLLVGGEACIWGEYVDKANLIPRVWPRASAVAEKLWSSMEQTQDVNSAAPRIEEFRCKLLSRGFMVDSLGPSFCPGDNL